MLIKELEDAVRNRNVKLLHILGNVENVKLSENEFLEKLLEQKEFICEDGKHYMDCKKQLFDIEKFAC